MSTSTGGGKAVKSSTNQYIFSSASDIFRPLKGAEDVTAI
jgi:hypothetical protein